MGLIDNGSGRFFAGMVVGYVAGLLTPPAIRVMPGVVRPLIKTSLRTALLGWERGRESIALLLENLEDVVAEVRAEVEADLVRAKEEPAERPERAQASRGERGGGNARKTRGERAETGEEEPEDTPETRPEEDRS